MGISGMRQTSAWISYGLMLHPNLFAGVGIHLENTSVAEDSFHQMEAGFALGLQFRISDELILGAHLANPAAWWDNLQAKSFRIPDDHLRVSPTSFSKLPASTQSFM